MNIVIFDLDGTLTDCTHRLHYIRTKPHDWRAFEAAIPLDTVNEKVAMIYRYMVADPDTTVILLTGRNEKSRSDTVGWLDAHNLTGYDELIMKTVKFMADTEQKRDAYDYIVATYGQQPAMVFEDRQRVVQMWKQLGLFVFDVDQDL